VFERLVDAARCAPAAPGTRIRLELCAGEWGKLQVELSLRSSGLRGEVIVESEAARSAILSRMDELRANLGRRGLRLAELQVTVCIPADEEDPRPRSERRQVLDVTA
jgi:hypothetical protein